MPCACQIIYYSLRENGVRAKERYTKSSRVSYQCSYHMLTSFVIYHWTEKIATGNIFV